MNTHDRAALRSLLGEDLNVKDREPSWLTKRREALLGTLGKIDDLMKKVEAQLADVQKGASAFRAMTNAGDVNLQAMLTQIRGDLRFAVDRSIRAVETPLIFRAGTFEE